MVVELAVKNPQNPASYLLSPFIREKYRSVNIYWPGTVLCSGDTVIGNKNRSFPSWNIQSNGGCRLQINITTNWVSAAEEMCVIM